ncbi:hypothetical protein [Actinocrispum wychmicini]|uniref:Concanavalin A-like lectin/glucanase superfamily protein n=1 Tax=Actinocrispum wychmicini TaxID=1213861 RepID=A0A4R2K004_9PSEU|nr:hypothetical protein [Actinocrispum wychmicini]TCO64957.1 hypothetical protein EV192_101741 [Actinocrispum wychmicini]
MGLDLSFPRRPVAELWLGGQWRTITTDVRQSPAVTITRGRKDESAKPSPSLCKFTLDDASHNYSPHDPMGVYYGQEFLNAPFRLALEVGVDNFARTTASGWGSSPQNGAWTTTTAGTAGTSVSSGEGRHSVTTTLSYALTTLQTITVRDVEVRTTVIIDSVSSVTGGSLEPANIALRMSNSGADYYLCRMLVNASNQVQLSIMERDTTTLAGPVTLTTAYSGQQWSVAASIEASTIRFKAWPTSGTEPQSWTVSTVQDGPFGAGWVGIRSGVGSGNTTTKPVVFRYDRMEIRLPRFAGEVSKWTPDRKLGEADRTIAVEASGLSRRLSQFKNPLRSSAYRYMTGPAKPFTPVEYWPLDLPKDATDPGANAVPGGVSAFLQQYLDANNQPAGAMTWGSGTGLVGVGRTAQVTNNGSLILPVTRQALIGNSYTVSWVMRLTQDSGGRIIFHNNTLSNDASITYFTDGSYEARIGAGPSTVIFAGQLPLAGYDDTWHTYSFSMYADSGHIVCSFSIDGVFPSGVAVSPATYTPLNMIEFEGGDIQTSGPGAFGNVAVFPQINANSLIYGLLDDAYRGHSGEAPANRFVRIAAEEGVATDSYGDYNPLRPLTLMGPQSEKTLLDLLDECVTVDRGSRYEPKSSVAVALRTVGSALNQTPAVSLDYSAGYVGDPFQPILDDQGRLNDVTTTRPGGGTYTVARTVGPKNTHDPGTVAGAVGRYDGSFEVNVAADAMLPEQAGWRLNNGTVSAPRYPVVVVDLRAPSVTQAVAVGVLDTGIDDLIEVTHATKAGVYYPARLLVRGYTETFDTAFRHTITFTGSPAEPYDVFVLGGSVLAGQSDSGNPSTLTTGVNTTATSLTVASTGYLWKTGAQTTQANLDGEQVTITNIAGSASPQTFTVTRSVNGVVKPHTAGAPIEVLNPRRLAPA